MRGSTVIAKYMYNYAFFFREFKTGRNCSQWKLSCPKVSAASFYCLTKLNIIFRIYRSSSRQMVHIVGYLCVW